MNLETLNKTVSLVPSAKLTTVKLQMPSTDSTSENMPVKAKL